MRARILDINPEADVTAMPLFYNASTAEQIDLSSYDFAVDAIDTVSSKLLLIERAAAERIPIISSMGAGNKLDPTAFEVADIYQTSVCPLARVMRRELKNGGFRRSGWCTPGKKRKLRKIRLLNLPRASGKRREAFPLCPPQRG